MRVNAIEAFTRSIGAQQIAPAAQRPVQAPAAAQSDTLQNQAVKRLSVTPQSVLTPGERQFFARLFPDNAGQIQPQAAFDRAGRVIGTGAVAGSIIDRRV